jgi:hypothetical protein
MRPSQWAEKLGEGGGGDISENCEVWAALMSTDGVRSRYVDISTPVMREPTFKRVRCIAESFLQMC